MDLAGMKRRELQALCKRHGLPAGGTNADLVARLDAALSGDADAEEEVAGGVPARKGCLKQTSGDAAEAKKVTFAAEEGKARRLRSRVIWSPVVPKKRGKSAQGGADSAAEDGISAEASADVPVRRSRRNSVSAAEAEEVGEAVAVDRKRKRKNQENDEGVAVSAQVGVSTRVTRRSSLAGPAAVLPPAVDKKIGRGKAAGASNKLVAEVQGSEPDVQKSAQVEVSARVTRSRTTASVVMSPTVVENKRRKTGDAQTNVEQSTVSDVPTYDAPVTRSLSNRAVQVNNSMVDETHAARQLENKTQPSRPPSRRRQQVSSSVEGKNQEQIAAPNKAPLLRRSGRNYSEDVEKQPAVKGPVRRSTRKSVVLANDIIEQKNPEAHVRRSIRKSIVPVEDIKGIGEEIQNTSSEDVAKQPATKRPVRGSRRKSVVSELHEKEKDLIAEKNIEAHEGKSMWKPVMPVKDIEAVGEGFKSAKGKDVAKQFVAKQPTRRSSRKSVLPNMLENNTGLLAAEMNADMNVRRSTRKSVLPNMLNEENQDHNKMARNENFQIGKCQDEERKQKVKEPIGRSRRSVAAVPLQEQNNGLYEEKISKIPMRRSTRKSVALNDVEKVSIDDSEIVARKPERVGEEGLKLREHRRSSLDISSSANDSWKMEDFDGQKFRKQQNARIPNEKDNTGGTQQTSNSTTLKGRSSKRRRTTASEEVRSVKEANDDIIIREATKEAHKASHEYKESGSRVQELGQVNATREEHSSGPLLVTVTLTDEISTAQSVPVVIPGPESGDNSNESSDKSKQEHSDIQAVDSHLSETSGKLDQSSCIAGLVPLNFVVSEDKAVLSKVSEESIQAADLGKCPSRGSIGNPLSTSLHLEGAPDDTSLPVLNVDKGCSSDGTPSSFELELMFAEECKESYSRNAENTAVEIFEGNSAVEIDGGNKPSTPVTPGFYVRSDCLDDEDVQPTECDADKKLDADWGVAEEVLAQEKSNDQHVPTKTDQLNDELASPGTESGCSITEKNASLVADSLDEQAIILVQHGDVQGGDLEKLSVCSATPLPEEIGGGKKPSTPVKPDFYVESDCLEDEDVQPTECDADKKLDVDQGVSEEEVLAQEKTSDQYVPDKTDLNMKLNDELAGPGMESGRSITEKNARLVADNLDEKAIILVQQGDVQEGDLEKLSVCSATLEYKLECGLPDENIAVEIERGNKPSTPITPDFYVRSDCLEVEDVQLTGFDADKKLDFDQGVAEEEVLAQQKSNDQHVPSKTDLNMKLNDELAGPCTESGCSITEKNARLFTDNLDPQTIFLVRQGDVQEGDLKTPSPCSTTPECKQKCGLPDETVLPPKNMGSLSSEAQSPFGLESLFSQENMDESMGSATAHTKNGFDDSKDCHAKSALENTHVSEPYSHEDTEECVSKNDDCMQTSRQDNGMEGLPKANLDEERVLSVFSLDTKHIKEVINFEEVACEGEVGKKLVHSEELKASSEKTNVNGPDGNAYVITDDVLSSALHTPANDNYEICVGSNTNVLHQGHNNHCSDDTEDIIEDTSAKYIERGCKERSNLKDGQLNSELEGAKVVESGLYFNKDIGNILDSGSVVGEITSSGSGLSKDSSKEYRQEVLNGFSMETSLEGSTTCGEKIVCRDAIENPSISLATSGYKREGALSEEAARTMKNYAGTCSSNPREVLMELQSLFSEENVKESYPHDGLAFPSPEKLGDESINVEVKIYHSSNLSQSGSPLLDEPIGCYNTEVLRQGHNHKDRSNEDRIEQVASELCTNGDYIVEAAAAAAAKCIESGMVPLPSEERSNLNGRQLNPKQKSPDIVESGLNCDKDARNTLNNGAIVAVVGNKTPSGSGYYEHNVYQVPDICAMSEAAPIEVIETGIAVEASSLLEEQPNPEMDGDEVEKHSLNCETDTCRILGTGSVMSNMALLPKDGHNHKDRSNVDRVEQVASEPCTIDIVKAAAAAKCIGSVLVLPPSEERSSLNDGQLNPKLESPNIMVPGLNCDKDVCNTSDNGSIEVVVSERTPFGCVLPEDYPKDHYPRQELLDVFSVESSLQGTIFAKTIVSGVAGIGNPSSSLATCDYKYEGALSEEAVSRMKNYTGTSSVDPRHLVMDLQSLFSEGSTEKSGLQDNLEFPSAESRRDEHIICHVEKLVDTNVSSEPDTYQGSCQDLSRHEEKESCMSVPMQVKESGGFLRSSNMKGSLTSVQIDFADDAHLIERDIVAAVEVLCEDERKSMPTSDSDILQEKSYSNGHGICQSSSQKHIVEANSRLFSCGTEVLYQDHKECNEPNEGKFSPKPLAENNMTEDALIEGIGSSMMVPLIAGMSEIPDEQLNSKMSDESEELSFSCDKATIENFCTGPAKRDLYPLPREFHIDSCHKQDVPEVLSSPKSREESAKFQCVRVSGSGPCQQRVNESTSMQVTDNIETLNQYHEEYNQNNEDHTTPEMEIGLIPAAEASLPDEQLNNKLEGNEVDGHNCSYDKDFSSLSDTGCQNREASDLHKDDCRDLSSEDNHPNDLPAPRSPEQSAYFQNNNDSGLVGSCQSSKRTGIDELRAKLQSFKVSSNVKGSYIAMSAPRQKPGDSMSQSAIALLRNIENTTAVKAGHPVKPNADGKDSSRRALQPISGRPREL